MMSTHLYRISRLSPLIGAVAFVIHIGLRSLLTAEVDPSTFAEQALWVLINAFGLMTVILYQFKLQIWQIGLRNRLLATVSQSKIQNPKSKMVLALLGLLAIGVRVFEPTGLFSA
jgi:hypothetical protein